MNLYDPTEMKDNFAILGDWDIRIRKDGPYSAQITLNADKKIADLWDWDAGDPENRIENKPLPIDFYFHEYLHAAFKAWQSLPENDRYDAEEQLIQDICRVVRKVVESINETIV